MNDVESYVRLRLSADAPAVMLAILGRVQEARQHVMDIVENMAKD